jgi:hypothetical protein
VAPAPSPSPDIAALGRAYLAEASKLNARSAALNKQLPTTSLATAKQAYAGFASIAGDMNLWLGAHTWPTSTQRDIKDLIKADSTLQVIESALAAVTTLEAFDPLQSVFNQEWTKMTAAASVVRRDLGLPPAAK